MLMQINTNIEATLLDMIPVHNFYLQREVQEKIPLILVLIWLIGNNEKDILIFGKGSTQSLDDTTLTAQAKH